MTFYNDTVQIQPNLLVLIYFEPLSNTNCIWPLPFLWSLDGSIKYISWCYSFPHFYWKKSLKESQKTSKTPLIQKNLYILIGFRFLGWGGFWVKIVAASLSDLLQNLNNPRNSSMIFLFTGSNIFNFSVARERCPRCLKLSWFKSRFNMHEVF